MSAEIILFALAAVVATASAILMVTRRNPLQSVLFLIVVFFCLAVLYLLLHAQFIAIIQILVYAGAIMVLFLFVVMLLNLGDEQRHTEAKSVRQVTAVAAAIAMFGQIAAGVLLPSIGGESLPRNIHPDAVTLGTVEGIGLALFRDYLFPFEMTSLLLLGAIVGVIVLAQKKFE